MRAIVSSDGKSLHFPDDTLYEEYEKELELLLVKTYKKIRSKYGIWAGNQGIFVRSWNELNRFDSLVMENLFDDYYRYNRKEVARQYITLDELT